MIRMRIWLDAWAGQLVRERKWHQSQEIRAAKGEVELTLELSTCGDCAVDSWVGGSRASARACGIGRGGKKVVKELGRMTGKVTESVS
jgi:hypothetical protein